MMPDAESWNRCVERYAPLDAWYDVLPDAPSFEGIAVHCERHEGYEGPFRVRLTPSATWRPYGIYIEINDHYQLARDEEGNEYEQLSQAAIAILNQQWDPAQERANDVCERLLSRTDGQ